MVKQGWQTFELNHTHTFSGLFSLAKFKLSVVQDNAIKLVTILQAMDKEKCVGAIVCKLDMHKKMVRRGYIAMLAVDSDYRRNNIGTVCYIVVGTD